MLMRPDFEQPPDVQCHRQERLAACEDQVQRVAALSMKHKPSVDFTGYWHIGTEWWLSCWTSRPGAKIMTEEELRGPDEIGTRSTVLPSRAAYGNWGKWHAQWPPSPTVRSISQLSAI